MTILYSDVQLFSKYSPVTLHLSPATRIFNENPAFMLRFSTQKPLSVRSSPFFHLASNVLPDFWSVSCMKKKV